MRLIDADALEKRMYVIPYYDNRDEDAVIDEIYKAPTVDAVPVVRGEWIYSRTQSEFAVSKCSACGKEQFSISHVVKDGKYCPNCGAKMDGKDGAK